MMTKIPNPLYNLQVTLNDDIFVFITAENMHSSVLNPSAQTGIFHDNYANTLAADTMTPCLVGSPAAMVLTTVKPLV